MKAAEIFRRNPMSRTSTAKAHRMLAQAEANVRTAAIVEIAAAVEGVPAVVAGDVAAGVADVTAAVVVVDATAVAAEAGIKAFATDLHGFRG